MPEGLLFFGGRIIFNQMVNNSILLNLIFGALADPTRRDILARLAKGSATVGELAEPHQMSLPAVSKHLKVLETAGLITRTRDGRIHHIGLDAKNLRTATEWMEYYRKFWDDKLDALQKYLESESKTEGEQK